MRARAHALTLSVLLLLPPAGAQEPLAARAEAPDFLFRFRPKVSVTGQRPFAVALGGGGGKGLAHVGVLQRLEEEGLEPNLLAGTSVGALVGSAFASGYSGRTLEDLFRRENMGGYLLEGYQRVRGETLSEQEARATTLLNLEFSRSGFSYQPASSPGHEVERALLRFLARGSYYCEEDFSRLRFPFQAVATNFQEGGGTGTLTSGNLVRAVRASIAIPGLIQPATIQGEQFVDGMLVENLPVRAARRSLPGAVVAAVEVGSRLETGRAGNIFSILGRSLDISIDQQTRISRAEADVLLRPDTRHARALDFQAGLDPLVAEGRAAFDGQLGVLEAALYGRTESTMGTAPSLEAPADLEAPLKELLAAAGGLPQRFLRRVVASGLAAAASYEPAQKDVPARIRVEPYAPLRELRIEAEAPWAGLLAAQLTREGVQPPARFNPVRLGRALEQVLLEAVLRGHPLVDFRGTAFDPASGCLTVRLGDLRWESVHLAPSGLAPRAEAALQRWVEPLAGEPVDTLRLESRLRLAQARYNLQDVGVVARPAAEGLTRLDLYPVSESRATVNGALGYESTWGAHLAVDARLSHFLSSSQALELHASSNRLEHYARVEFLRSFPVLSRTGCAVFVSRQEHRFIQEALTDIALLEGLKDLLLDTRQRTTDVGVGIFTRFGREDRGLVRLDASRRAVSLGPLPFPWEYTSRNVQLSAEWDNLDRYVLPTRGFQARLMTGQGRLRDLPESAPWTYRYHYLRLRGLRPLGPRVGLDLDLEGGLGWNTLTDRWFLLGGPSSILGTRSAGYVLPNFALARLSFPIRLWDQLAMPMQVEPALLYGHLGNLEPGELRDGIRLRGVGLFFRTEISSFQLEFSLSRLWRTRPDSGGMGGPTLFNLTLGTKPFDLWRRR